VGLRHTFGARIIDQFGNDYDTAERIAMELLHHKERKMTKYYTQIVKEKIKSV